MLIDTGANRGDPVVFTFEDALIETFTGATVASSLLAAGEIAIRCSVVSGEPRAPFCLMGVCFECLVEVDGQPNQQACMIPARAGMVVRRERGSLTSPRP